MIKKILIDRFTKRIQASTLVVRVAALSFIIQKSRWYGL